MKLSGSLETVISSDFTVTHPMVSSVDCCETAEWSAKVFASADLTIGWSADTNASCIPLTSPGPMALAVAVFIGGCLHTGDGGYMDDEGFLYIVDRVKDMIISGGENVYSAGAENALYQHETINQYAVIGIPHGKWGEQVHAVVVLKVGSSVDEASLIDHCTALISGFKCSRSVSFQSEPLPLSGAGKILKTELRKPF